MGNDFGHVAINGPGFCMDSWGVGPFIINGIRFEDSDRFGPALICKDGELKKNPYPSEKHPFWRWHRIWVRQGRRVKEDGITCIFDEPKPTRAVQLGNKDFWVVEAGEEDGKLEVINDESVTSAIKEELKLEASRG